MLLERLQRTRLDCSSDAMLLLITCLRDLRRLLFERRERYKYMDLVFFSGGYCDPVYFCYFAFHFKLSLFGFFFFKKKIIYSVLDTKSNLFSPHTRIFMMIFLTPECKVTSDDSLRVHAADQRPSTKAAL